MYMSFPIARSRTLKKTHDISGQVVGELLRKANELQSDTLLRMIEQEAGGAYRRPWHRLERGLRLNRLRQFAEEEAQRLQLKEREKTALYQLLTKSLEKKMLNSKTAVIYDQEKEKITEIKGLVMHRNADGDTLFQIVDKQKGVTFRRKKNTDTQDAKETAV